MAVAQAGVVAPVAYGAYGGYAAPLAVAHAPVAYAAPVATSYANTYKVSLCTEVTNTCNIINLGHILLLCHGTAMSFATAT